MGRPVNVTDLDIRLASRSERENYIHFPSLVGPTHNEQIRRTMQQSGRGPTLCTHQSAEWSTWWSDVTCPACHAEFDKAVEAAVASTEYHKRPSLPTVPA